MQILKTIFFGLLLVSMYYYYYHYEVEKIANIVRQKQEARELFPQVTGKDIHQITIQGEKGDVSLVKEGETWLMKSPYSAQGDQKEADSLADALASMKLESVIEDTPDDYKEFGLEKPRVRIGFATSQGEKSLLIGDANPSDTLVYGKTGSEARILAFLPAQKKQVNKGGYDLRDKAILPMKKDEVKNLFIASGEVQLHAFLNDQDVWMVEKPFHWRADRGTIDSIMKAIFESEIKQFISEEPEGFSEYGLKKPRATLTFAKENEKKETLLLGGKQKNQKRIFARRLDAKNVFTIPESLLEKIPEKAEDFRDRYLFPEKKGDHITKMRFTGEESLLLQKDADGNWNFLEPEKSRADYFETNQWADHVARMEIRQFLEDQDKNSPEFGLKNPMAAIDFWEKGSEESSRVLIGNQSVKKDGRYVCLPDEPGVFLIDEDAFRKLQVSFMKLRDKKLARFDTEEIKKIWIQKGLKKIELKQTGEEWKVYPSGKKLKGNPVRSLLWDVIDLSFHDVAAKGEIDLKNFGLDNPSLSIKLWNEKGEDAAIILFGKEVTPKEKQKEETDEEASPEYYVLSGDRKEVYRVKADILKNMDKKLSEWETKP